MWRRRRFPRGPVRARSDLCCRRSAHTQRLAEEFEAETWRTIAWREGTNTELNSRFAAVRLRPASRDYNRPEAHAEEWLLIEWPEGEVEPSKYWLSTLPADATITQLVDAAKLRWRIERDYQELKQELGLGHYEGRGWRGFHHHASLCIAAYGFLVSLRETIPPSTPTRAQGRQTPGLPDGYRPRRSSDPTRAARPDLDPNPQATLTVALANRLQRCPCCIRAMDSPRQARNL
ncbi:transposase [Mesorhizobium sp. M1322]|uniref:IS701 family transposase n=1 Tax=Mesorhizobium sp. M1322 TaxID=2957081 RepID=UPI00333CEC88